MSRRVIAGLLAAGLAVVLIVSSFLLDVPFVRFQPGPTFDVVATRYDATLRPCTRKDCKPLVAITGHKVYPDDGQLRMVTVRPDGPTTKVTLVAALIAWANPDVAVLPKDAVYPDHQTDKQSQQQSAVEMTSSQDNATAAALNALGIKYRTEVQVSGVDPKGASAGILRKGDLLTGVDGRSTADANALVSSIRAFAPGSKIRLSIERGSTAKVVTVVTRPAADDKKASRVGISIAQKFRFPFQVKFQLSDRIGGPSAGMMFALSLYDLLTPGSLTGGRVIAGSGEINAAGVVGPIGGIGQKLVGAQADGARLFLVAQENCAEAVRSHYDKKKLRLVKVHTLRDAIDALNTWRKNPDAALPRCTK